MDQEIKPILRQIAEAIDDYRTGLDNFGSYSLDCPYFEKGQFLKTCTASPMGNLPCEIGNCFLRNVEL